MDKSTFYSLIDKYQEGTASPAEKTLLEEYYRLMATKGQMELTGAEEESVNEKMFHQIKKAIDSNDSQSSFSKSFYTWRRLGVAASILLAVSFGVYFLYNKSVNEIPVETAKTNAADDVKAPVISRATITLANGNIVYLDSASKGTLAVQGGVNVVKNADGQIIYGPLPSHIAQDKLAQGYNRPGEMQYNILSNPRGSRIVNLTLEDGTKVWLNSESSIKYPTAFSGKERKVEITGEAYFEVTHNINKPFFVTKGDVQVQVLGTHFNVKAYEDEVNIKVTLLEGSVKASIVPLASSGGQSKVLKPGEQAQIANSINVVKGVDMDEVMAWKNGNFYFNASDIQTIMRQVARWYDVEVSYEGGIPTGHYNGKPSRDLTASEMLKVVEYSGVKVRIEGKKITVMK